mmetsp:Transcript_29597/g.39360  ORF Transcript_29597/g.39360 Transcript_29597/m.39360 type:complete len:91 (-) Transcript_29597:2615-2887(-)
MTSIEIPSLDSTKKYNLSAARVPHELFESTVMRVSDLATLIKLTQAQFFEDWSNLVRFEDHLDFCQEIMIRKNPPRKLRAYVKLLKRGLQ